MNLGVKKLKDKDTLLRSLNILVESLGNKKKNIQDLTAINILLIGFLLMLFLLSTFLVPLSPIIDILVLFVIAFGINFGNIIQGKNELFIPGKPIEVKFVSLINDVQNLLLYTYGKLILVVIIMTVLTTILMLILKPITQKRFFITIFNINLLALIIVIVAVYKVVLGPLLLGLVLLSIILIFQPVGTGKYYKILKRLYYLLITNSGFKVRPTPLKITLLILVILTIVTICHIYLPMVSKVIPITLSLSIIILVGSESLKKEVHKLTVKLLFYLLIIPVIIFSKSTESISIESILLATIAIYFSIERIITIAKKIENELREHNVHFNMNEYEDEYEKEKLIKELVPVAHLEHVALKEDEFVSQLVKYFHVRDEVAVNKLIDMYRKNNVYSHYDDLITSFLFILNYSDVDKKEQYKFLKGNLKFENQNLVLIDIIEKYFFLWDEFETNKNYKEMFEVLESYYALLSEEALEKLKEVKKKLQKKKKSKPNSVE